VSDDCRNRNHNQVMDYRPHRFWPAAGCEAHAQPAVPHGYATYPGSGIG
jgi:hypothetical protein